MILKEDVKFNIFDVNLLPTPLEKINLRNLTSYVRHSFGTITHILDSFWINRLGLYQAIDELFRLEPDINIMLLFNGDDCVSKRESLNDVFYSYDVDCRKKELDEGDKILKINKGFLNYSNLTGIHNHFIYRDGPIINIPDNLKNNQFFNLIFTDNDYFINRNRFLDFYSINRYHTFMRTANLSEYTASRFNILKDLDSNDNNITLFLYMIYNKAYKEMGTTKIQFIETLLRNFVTIPQKFINLFFNSTLITEFAEKYFQDINITNIKDFLNIKMQIYNFYRAECNSSTMTYASNNIKYLKNIEKFLYFFYLMIKEKNY